MLRCGQEDVTCGLVDLVPKVQSTNNVLMLTGTTGAATKAAPGLRHTIRKSKVCGPVLHLGLEDFAGQGSERELRAGC